MRKLFLIVSNHFSWCVEQLQNQFSVPFINFRPLYVFLRYVCKWYASVVLRTRRYKRRLCHHNFTHIVLIWVSIKLPFKTPCNEIASRSVADAARQCQRRGIWIVIFIFWWVIEFQQLFTSENSTRRKTFNLFRFNSFKFYDVKVRTDDDVNHLKSLDGHERFDLWSIPMALGSTVTVMPQYPSSFENLL